jgi:hypothetical protein
MMRAPPIGGRSAYGEATWLLDVRVHDTRFACRATHYLGMLILAATLLWLSAEEVRSVAVSCAAHGAGIPPLGPLPERSDG